MELKPIKRPVKFSNLECDSASTAAQLTFNALENLARTGPGGRTRDYLLGAAREVRDLVRALQDAEAAASFKVGERVVLTGNDLPDEPGVVEADEGGGTYLVRVDKPADERDADRLREVSAADMRRA